MGAQSSKELGLDWASRAAAVRELQVGLEGDGEFFNRKMELTSLLGFLSAPPTNVKVIVGPNDCGKTLLLKQLKKIWKSNEALAATSPVFHVDMRKLGWQTPEDAAVDLVRMFQTWCEKFRPWADRMRNAGKSVTLKIKGVAEVKLEGIMDAFLGPNASEKSSDLAFIMHRISMVVDSNPLAHPIFILDEADILKQWRKEDLKTFAGCFKSLVKQDHSAYLILSSSDDFFRQWLPDLFNPTQWDAFGVGYFSADEARKFFDGFSLPKAMAAASAAQPAALTEDDWKEVYAVCGGSPMQLNLCASLAVSEGVTWKEAAEVRMLNCTSLVESGMSATREVEGFEGNKYEEIAKKIVNNGYVSTTEVLKTAFLDDKVDCKTQLKAMLAGNHIHVRYVTPVTRYADLNLQPSVKRQTELLMAPSPAHCAAMKYVLCDYLCGNKHDEPVLSCLCFS